MSTEFQETSREPLRAVVDTPQALQECLASLAAASGPVAFDAERAHGHRYWPKAYLFQIRRAEAGTWLIDPIAFEDQPGTLSQLVDVCGQATWIVHAASQDLPCMREVGIYPTRIFDTELAARLMGEPSVGLRALLETKLGIRLRKAHSADNWATRPLPPSWLTYAALDVDYLIELAEVISRELEEMGRSQWAEQEFEATLAQFAVEPEQPAEPWRRLSNITSLKRPRQLAVARALWEARDDVARKSDRPPTRLLADAAIVSLAASLRDEDPLPTTAQQLQAHGGFRTRSASRYRTNWLKALASVQAMQPSEYPRRSPRRTGLGHPRTWQRKHPQEAEAWARVKPAIDELACDLNIQASLLAPAAVVQPVVFHHHREQDFAPHLKAAGARQWQLEFLDPLLREHLA